MPSWSSKISVSNAGAPERCNEGQIPSDGFQRIKIENDEVIKLVHTYAYISVYMCVCTYICMYTYIHNYIC